MHAGWALRVSCWVIVLGVVSGAHGQGPLAADEQLLKGVGIATDNDGLLKYLRQRSSVPTNDASHGPQHAVAAARLLAARGVFAAVEVLFNYLPHVRDDWARDELLDSLGVLTVQTNRIDPVLQQALKDRLPVRRAAAVYVLGRRGDLDQREAVRSFLDDPDDLPRQWAAQSLAGKRTAHNYSELAAGDEKLLRSLGLATDEPALLEILRKRTIQEDDEKRIRQLIRELGAPAFTDRSRASRLLIKESTPALGFLKAALDDADAEVVRRASLCIEEIRRGPGPALPTAAVRLLARPAREKMHSPAAAIRVLLAYAPCADDEAVEEEIATALTLLSAREVRVDPLLPEALRDTLAARRALAAQVLGRVGTAEHRPGLRKLLDDPETSVRLRAAQALLAARDASAVPSLIALLDEVPPASLYQVEELLQRLAGPEAPAATVADGTAEKRQLAVKAWTRWLAAHHSHLDLAAASEADAYLGLVTVCEYDSGMGQPGGQVWEAGRDGKQRWLISGVQGAMDAQVLPHGRVLIAENSANRVTERDLTGAIKWEYRTPGNPIACQRLPNGNTFIATYNQVMEITPDQRQLYVQTRGPQFYIFSARKTRDGQVVAMTAQGNILRFDPLANKDSPIINLGPNGGWCSAEALPNGRYLVATMNDGQVREIDADGIAHWKISMPGAFRATRLPNGNTLVASMSTRLIAEFDRHGNKRWEKLCAGRPWSIRYR